MATEEQHPDIQKFLAHYPSDADMTLQVLKGHLLLEELLREIFQLLLIRPEALKGEKGTSLNCHQIICLVEALAPKRNDQLKWIWLAAKRLNTLRNDLAHKLSPLGLDEKIQSFIQFVRQSDQDVELHFKKVEAPQRLEFAMSVSTLCGIFSRMKEHIASASQAST